MNTIKLLLPVAGLAMMVAAVWTSVGSASAGVTDAPAVNNAAAAANAHAGHAEQVAASVGPTVIGPTVILPPGPKPVAKSPEELLKLLGDRIVAKDLDGIIALQEPEAAIVNFDLTVIRGQQQIRAFYAEWFKSNPVLTVKPGQVLIAGGQRGVDGKLTGRAGSIMGTYSLEQDGPDGTRVSFTGNFCDIVHEQPNGTWLYVQDNPYPPHH